MTNKPKKRVVKKARTSVPDAEAPAHKLRYRFKPGFASKVKEHARKAYRADKGKDFEISGATVLRSLDFLEEHTETTMVRNVETKKAHTMPIVRLMNLANLLDTSYQTIWRWTSSTGQLPEPILTAEDSMGVTRPVYHVEEVKIMIREIGEHLNNFKYYRKDHIGTRERIYRAIEAIRNANYGESSNGNHQKGQGAPEQKTRRRLVRKG